MAFALLHHLHCALSEPQQGRCQIFTLGIVLVPMEKQRKRAVPCGVDTKWASGKNALNDPKTSQGVHQPEARN